MQKELVMEFKRQRGATLTSAIIAIFVGGFFLTVAFKLGPHYLDNRIIQGAIVQIGQSGLEGQSSAEIRRKVGDFFIINNIRHISSDQVMIKRSGQGVEISLDYEKRIEMFGNIDVVVKFSNGYNSAEPNP
jgi:hypothetical protein